MERLGGRSRPFVSIVRSADFSLTARVVGAVVADIDLVVAVGTGQPVLADTGPAAAGTPVVVEVAAALAVVGTAVLVVPSSL